VAGATVGYLLVYLVLTMVPAALCWLLLSLPDLFDFVLRLRHRHNPSGPSIQFLAQRLRHVHRTLLEFEPGTPALRRYAARQAYDDLLRQACQALEVPQRLDEFPEGMDKEIERLRVEEALRRAGLRIP
jgi:hypothetical protein